ncbi:hypothetical protein KIH87_08525 [Paraneptunicella aestuarii]|uniref:hypothetical protein n=1 Tax=Paraneptunicella aestuarii TaxID=2831148 RepID=UPI001E64DA01|nr:hypothetical protein [Paraneptunicella aestuarii]UAA40363.1 hypothetical protein KIH87_08525 [Paraneptunicella aestuarii]
MSRIAGEPFHFLWRKYASYVHDFFLLLLTLIFLISVNWLAKLVIQFFFGSSADDNTLLLLKHHSLTVANHFTVQVNLVWLGLCLLLGVVVIKVVWYHFSKTQQERRAMDFGHYPGISLFPGTLQHAALLTFLVFFGIALGWLSDGISAVLQSHWLNSSRLWLFSGGLLLVLTVCQRLSLQLGVIVAVSAYTLLLMYCTAPLCWALVLSLLTGYVFFEQVKAYAQPKSVTLGKNEGHPAFGHLIVFLSALNKPVQQAVFPADVRERLRSQLNDVVDEALIQALGQPVWHKDGVDKIRDKGKTMQKVLQDDPNLKEIKSLLDDAHYWLDFIRLVLACCVQKSKVLDLEKRDLKALDFQGRELRPLPILLSQVVCFVDAVTSKVTNWQMMLIAMEHHLGFNRCSRLGMGPPAPLPLVDASKLRMSFLLSKDEQFFGNTSASSMSELGLLQSVFALYSDPQLGALLQPANCNGNKVFDPKKQCFVYMDTQEKGMVCQSLFHASCSQGKGIDFEDYYACLTAVNSVAKAGNVPLPNTIVDFTGGKKITSMAATMASTTSDMKVQYVSNDYQIKGYDLRYYDFEKMGG